MINLNQKYVKAIKGSKTYNCTKVNVLKNGKTYNVWRAAKAVTYVVDDNVVYREDVVRGNSVLSPTTFTPSKSGYTFVGWREDMAGSSSVLSSKTMGDSEITLYAVFKQTITLSYSGNGSNGGSTASQSGIKYYNNGNVSNPSFTLASNGFARSGYFFTRWDLGAVGSKITLSESKTAYAQWHTYTAFTKVTHEYAKVGETAVYIVQNIDGSKVKGISFYVDDAWTSADWQGTQYVSKMWLKTSSGQEQLLSEYWIGAAGDHNSSSEKGKTLTVTWSSTETISVYLQAEVNGSGDAGAVLTDGMYIPR